jgi:regulator of sigma E protease
MSINFLVGLVEFVLALVALIILHEFGHFIAARLLNIDVEEFGLGFPPRVATLFTAWGTKFTLNALPLGGFVRPKGENDPEVPGGLAAANPWKRLVVLFAGPAMNLLIGVILYAVIFAQIGAPDYSKVQVVGVSPDSPAASAGLQPGDILKSLNNTPIQSMVALQDAINNTLDKPATLTYERSGQDHQVTITPRSQRPNGQGPIGITMENPIHSISFFQAIPAGVDSVARYSRLLLTIPVQMIQGSAPADQGRLVGLKGMFDIYQEARSGAVGVPGIPSWVNILGFFSSITISLGLLNLVPFPALDGGRIFFTLPEIILRRRIPVQYENLINLVGFALLLLLMIYINLQDFISPLTLPK